MSKSIVMTVRMTEDNKDRLSEAAKADGRTFNNLINKILSDWLADKKGDSA